MPRITIQPFALTMSLDLRNLADKLRRYRQQFDATLPQVAESTGIPVEAMAALERGELSPSGDQILILADYYKCDFKFFISNDRLAPFEQTENLFRRFGDDLSAPDRWSIQEFLFLCENESFLAEELGRVPRDAFEFTKRGKFYKRHADEAAKALRTFLGYKSHEIPADIFHDFRRIGIHIFRRHLENSNISGIFIKHPTAGKCVLVNYSEDVYRQRFTATHEVGHSILDDKEDFVVSFKRWNREDLVEIRANAFAGHFLVPAAALAKIDSASLTPDSIVDFADRLRVNTDTLVFALKREGILTEVAARSFMGLRIPKGSKIDPELPPTLSARGRQTKHDLLRRGISTHYAQLCFDAYRQGVVSLGRLAEMMLGTEKELWEIGKLFGWSHEHES
ncbi:helix-turn-helix domain-containing protein [Myxococcus virescens]|uniref:helix-turn-helix domain-containing protein n=1 Tax=Myxococcus virescens TaxID=83456 RepID=UPI003DA54530